jgi:hypothetical protein
VKHITGIHGDILGKGGLVAWHPTGWVKVATIIAKFCNPASEIRTLQKWLNTTK